MAVELTIPEVGESITEALIGEWLKREGEWVEKDEIVAELETDKVTVELPAPVAGLLVSFRKQVGDTAAVGEVIATIDDAAGRPAGAAKPAAADAAKPAAAKSAPAARPQREEPPVARTPEEAARTPEEAARTPEEAARTPEEAARTPEAPAPGPGPAPAGAEVVVMPAARRALAEAGLEASQVEASGPGGRLLKEDVERHVGSRTEAARTVAAPAPAPTPVPAPAPAAADELVPMSPIRRRIAERLVAAQREAALLSTFNEVDMSAVMGLRREYREAFEARHGVRLGFMSFFVKACVDALGQFPQLNAEVRGTDIVYRNHYDIGIAVSTDRGLVVPVLRSAQHLGFAEIEKAINDFAERARSGKLKLQELEGGTFTITNGGVFGSLLSTPIVNPPQSGVLGLHAIEERPVAIAGEVVVRPMMYIALTYDHRIVDGREAVTFLKRIKESIADPTRMLLEV